MHVRFSLIWWVKNFGWRNHETQILSLFMAWCFYHICIYGCRIQEEGLALEPINETWHADVDTERDIQWHAKATSHLDEMIRTLKHEPWNHGVRPAYLGTAGNGGVAEVIRERQHLRGRRACRSAKRGALPKNRNWQTGAAFAAKNKRWHQLQPTFGLRESTVRAQGAILPAPSAAGRMEPEVVVVDWKQEDKEKHGTDGAANSVQFDWAQCGRWETYK